MELILKYFPHLSEVQQRQFAQLKPLYEEWNAQINVISRKDMDAFYERHVLHSLGIARVHSFEKGHRVLDIGTGGGFPGIPLAILFPDTHFHLVDSIGKKIKVVQAVADALALKNVTATHTRAEAVDAQFEYIVSRAVTHIDRFLPWTKGKIKKAPRGAGLQHGILYLKGGFITDEFINVKQYTVYELPDYFKEDFFETKKVVFIPA
jgi:16S rRNA (guanine527-N7)-methyltransferase